MGTRRQIDYEDEGVSKRIILSIPDPTMDNSGKYAISWNRYTREPKITTQDRVVYLRYAELEKLYELLQIVVDK